MSGISGVSSNSNFEALAVAINKRVIDEQGQAALSLLESTAESVQQIQNTQASGSLGANIDIRV